MKNLPTTNGSEIKVKRPKKTLLRTYKPWPFRVVRVPFAAPPPGVQEADFKAGRALGEYLYTSVSWTFVRGLMQVMHEKGLEDLT